MNNLIVKILRSPYFIGNIERKLPLAFETVGQQASGPEVGVLREAVLIGMFMAFFGDEQVTPNENAVEADIDCYVGNFPLSIKTITGTGMGGIRIKWTSETEKAEEFIFAFAPQCDLLVVRIVWGRTGRISYIPMEVQQDVFSKLKAKYLTYAGGTNTRGVNLSREALSSLEKDERAVIMPLYWHKSLQPQPRYERWVSYWRDERDFADV